MADESQFELRLKGILAAYALPGSLLTMGTTTLRVYLKNYEGDVMLAEGNVVPPDGGVDYAKGCFFVKNDAAAGTTGLYENWGTKTSCQFRLISGAITIGIVSQHTITESENVTGLASAIALANSLKTKMNAHAADLAQHSAADAVNFPVTTVASSLATLKTLMGELLTAYEAHYADAVLGSGWAYHVAGRTTDAPLASSDTPTTLAECIVRLNDLKEQFNIHDSDTGSHSLGSLHQETTADADGTQIEITVTDALAGDYINWSVLTHGGEDGVDGVSATAGTDKITFLFDGDPGTDTIISYHVIRKV